MREPRGKHDDPFSKRLEFFFVPHTLKGLERSLSLSLWEAAKGRMKILEARGWKFFSLLRCAQCLRMEYRFVRCAASFGVIASCLVSISC